MKEPQKIDFLTFQNTSIGEMVFAEMVDTVVKFMTEEPEEKYRVMIGSDSKGRDLLDVVSVVAVHRVGSGGRYFWHRSEAGDIYNLRQKIYSEVMASLQLASMFLPAFRRKLSNNGYRRNFPYDFEIHVDVGENGDTRDLISEITGMVTAYGYEVMVKPESAAATTFADRHVR